MAGGMEGAEGKEERKTLRKKSSFCQCVSVCVSVAVHVSMCACAYSAPPPEGAC